MKYTIKKGDSLKKIAKRFSIDIADLLAANPELKEIGIGVKIDIPTEEEIEETPKKSYGSFIDMVIDILKTLLFKVRVENFPEEIKVEVKNPIDTVSISNFKDINFPDIPEFPDFPEYPSDISISNFEDIKFPDIPDTFDIKDMEKILDHLDDIKNKSIFSDDPRNYVPVRLTDGEEFYKALSKVVVSYDLLIKSLSNSLYPRVTNIQNLLNSVINDNKLNTVVNPTLEYKISDIVNDSEIKYYGFIKNDGSWYIMKDNNGEYRYAKGDDDYPTAWTNRATQTYDYFNEIFGG